LRSENAQRCAVVGKVHPLTERLATARAKPAKAVDSGSTLPALVGEGALARAMQTGVTCHANFGDQHRATRRCQQMNLNTKVPPPPRLPQGLVALARASYLPHASTRGGAEPRSGVEPAEATRAWKPDRTLLKPEPKPESASDFALAADEQTVVGAINLKDPSLFRSQPPAAPIRDAKAEWAADEETTIDFVGSLAGLDRDEAPPAMTSPWGDESTRLYRPQRSHLSPEEPSDELEETSEPAQGALLGPEPPKVIIARTVLAESPPDTSRAEATKRRRGRRGTDTKLGLSLCLVGALALALGAAWRHPRTAPATHEAFTRVAITVSSLLGARLHK